MGWKVGVGSCLGMHVHPWWIHVNVWQNQQYCKVKYSKKKKKRIHGELYKKDLHDPDNHNDVITNLEPDILECEVKWTLGSVTVNKESGGY